MVFRIAFSRSRDAVNSKSRVLKDGEREYVWGQSLAYSVLPTTAHPVVNVYHTDGMDSARVLTGSDGSVTDINRTDAFGVVVSHQGDSDQPFGFTGEQRDSETGLMPLGARSYDPFLGRFMQRDPQIH